MASKIGSIYVDLGLRTATFQKRLKRASSNLGRSVNRMKNGLRSMAKPITMITGLLGGLGAISFTSLIRSTLESADALAKHADRLGLTTEALGGLRFAAEQTGSEISGLDVGLQRMVRRISDANAGNKGLRQTFQELNLDVARLAALSPDQQFIQIADAISKLPSQGERVRQTFKIFDTEGVKLKNLLDTGGEGVRELIREFESLGGTISRLDAAKMEMANDSINRMKVSFTGLTNQLAIQFAPLLTVLSQRLAGAAQQGNGLASIIERVIGIGVTGFGLVSNAIHFLKLGIGAVITGFYKLNEAVYNGRALFLEFSASALDGLEKVRSGIVEIARKIGEVIQSIVNRVGNFIVGMINEVLSKVSQMVNSSINTLIDGVNAVLDYLPGQNSLDRVNFSAGRVPEIKVKLVGDEIGGGDSLLTQLAQSARESAESLRGEGLASGAFAESIAAQSRGVLAEGLPSDRLRAGFEKMKEESQAAAQQIADNAKANIASFESTGDAAGGLAGAVGKIGGAAKAAREAVAGMTESAKEKMEEAKGRVQVVTRNMTSAFESFVDTGKISFKSLVDSMLRELVKFQVRSFIEGATGGSRGGILGAIFGGIGRIAGFRADGGPVTGGRSYIVGERGPELFSPGTSGTIIPNESLRSAGPGGASTVINETYNIQPGVSREELRISLEEMARVRDEQRRRMIESGEADFAGLVGA